VGARKRKGDPHNCTDGEKGETRTNVAKLAGFGSYATYGRAQTVYESGRYDLFVAIDKGEMSINSACNIVKGIVSKKIFEIGDKTNTENNPFEGEHINFNMSVNINNDAKSSEHGDNKEIIDFMDIKQDREKPIGLNPNFDNNKSMPFVELIRERLLNSVIQVENSYSSDLRSTELLSDSNDNNVESYTNSTYNKTIDKDTCDGVVNPICD
jgi:hypothetical protein